MSQTTTITLEDGVKYGDNVHHDITLREPLAGDLLDAQAEAERPMVTDEGWQLLVSNAAMTMNVLRRQIVRIGEDIDGPMPLQIFKRLTSRDLEAVRTAAETLEAPMRLEVEKRGRSERPGGSDETS